MHRIQRLNVQLRYLPWILRIVWQAASPWAITWLLLIILSSILPILVVYLTRDVVDGLVAVVDSNFQDWIVVSGPVLLLIAIVSAQALLGSVTAWVRTVQAEYVRDYVLDLIHHQSARLDVTYFESTQYYDQLHRALVDALQKPSALLENLGGILQSTITLIGMLAILLAYAPWLPLLLLVGTLPALWVLLRYSIRFNQWRIKNTLNERRSQYHTYILTDRDAVGEVRLFDLASRYIQKFNNLRTQLREERKKLELNKLLTELLAIGASLLLIGVGMLWMLQQVVSGTRSLGDLAVFYQVFSQGQNLMRSLLNNAAGIYQNILFLENLYEFLHLESTVEDSEPQVPMVGVPLRSGIRFENITFRYPGSERPALDNFNWVIPAGKIVALVGENGEGKSTLMKLLCRLYDPQEGTIYLDDVDVKHLPLQQLRRQIGVLFQVPFHYDETVYDNIAVGNLNDNPTIEDVKIAAKAAGADTVIDSLPDQYQTVLGKWFGGEELSGGQWQRVALARALLRKSGIIVLDEPTSAMDSWAEYKWLQRLRSNTLGSTTIMITHRWTTAMYADVIYVMYDGKISESGTHDELLALNGRYARSWQQQLEQAP